MILEYIHPNMRRERITLQTKGAKRTSWKAIHASSKIEFIKAYIPSYLADEKQILFDANHKQLADFHKHNDINRFDGITTVNKDARILFFTSGSSGFPVGAFKSRENLEREIEALKEVISGYPVKRIVVTVPFVHIYGILAGLLLPLRLDNVTLVVKEDFLPYELLEEASHEATLVITTPVFIKALPKLDEQRDLSGTLFISSTGPLQPRDAGLLQRRFGTTLLQLFGSTETGGIAYKVGISDKWTALPEVKISSNNERLRVDSPFVSSYIIDETIKSVPRPFQTEDVVEISTNSFKLIGRSNKLIKIAGKRISALQIEALLESLETVEKALVSVVYKKELLRSEQIAITLQTGEKIEKKRIKSLISQHFGTLSIPFSVTYVNTINTSAMGKKVLF